MGGPFETRLRVRHYEVDEYGHVNHASYVHYLEVARIEALESIGLPLADMRREGYLIVVTEMTVRYQASARSGDTLAISTAVREMRAARSTWDQEIRDAATGRVMVTAEITGAFVNEDGRPVRIPAAYRDKLTALSRLASSTPGDYDPPTSRAGGPR
jgi:YbgC/YbaW family acyl-CoA thioester hydrolase